MTRVRAASLFLAGAAARGQPGSPARCRAATCRSTGGIAWGGFDSALATSLALTGVAALRRAAWLDRAAVATATLLAADAWFDVVTSRGALAVAFATTEALAVEIPVALLCLWVARSVATTNAKGALQ